MKPTKDDIKDATAKYIEQLENGRHYSISKFDDQILYISSGALVLSLSFIGSTVSLENSTFIFILYVSWMLLVATSMMSVYTHYASYLLHARQIERINLNEKLLIHDTATTKKNITMFWMLVSGISLQVYL